MQAPNGMNGLPNRGAVVHAPSPPILGIPSLPSKPYDNQALPHLREHFGNIVFALRATSDEYGWQRLYVDALWPGDSTDAFLAIDRFQDAWWIANSHMTAGHLTFTYRLV